MFSYASIERSIMHLPFIPLHMNQISVLDVELMHAYFVLGERIVN